MQLQKIVESLSNRNATRTEAMIQADIRELLLTAPLGLSDGDVRDVVMLEAQVGDGRRIDIEIGCAVIEVKRDLRKGKVLENAIKQLAGYVATREKEFGVRYVGILSDGAEWRCYHLHDNELFEVSTYSVSKVTMASIEQLLVWLEGVLATCQSLSPSPNEIKLRLGAGSSSYALDRATLERLYKANEDNPSVLMKRKLWSKLLTTALGTQFEDSDQLFIEHTLLVNSAEIIAHAVLGLQVELIDPHSLLSGTKFDESGIFGIVEADFFDWVVEIPEGNIFVRTLAKRLARFDWSYVEHDVLKILYESVIGTKTRKKLGEYYTPDWLAEKIVETVVSESHIEKVLDPACGSGTFLFHAIRKFFRTTKESGLSVRDLLDGVTSHVMGLDIHPVAVAFARVTYLLAIGRERLTDPNRGIIHVPVYLGDSLQWKQEQPSLFTRGNLVVEVDECSQLEFPDNLLENAFVFDELVAELAEKASHRPTDGQVPTLSGVFQRLAIDSEYHELIKATFRTMCRLHDEGRNHIWSYYVRNLARPVWMARLENRVDVLVGNPPWLAFRHMTPEMQSAFRQLSKSRELWHGATVATHQDLSGLFIVRSIAQYLKKGGRFGFVVPNAVVDRAQFAGFRTGEYPDHSEPVTLQFNETWDLRRLRPHFFPRGSAVITGTRSDKPSAMPESIAVWSGRIPSGPRSWAEVEKLIKKTMMKSKPSTKYAQSIFRERFTQGAILSPRLLFYVKEKPTGPLGVPAGKVLIQSSRGANEKQPWKGIQSLEGVIETEFLRPLYLGENVLPYRTLEPLKAVIPWDSGQLLECTNERIEWYPGLANWWHRAEEIWNDNRRSKRLSLVEQLDYRQKLRKQFPIQEHRIVYTKSGMHLAAARVSNDRGIINNSLYWATPSSNEEALYLCAILNAAAVTQLVRPLMSYGKDERHFDKYIWQLPIPAFDRNDAAHLQLATLGGKLESEISQLEINKDKHFSAIRRQVRAFIEKSVTGQEIETLVSELLG